MIDEKKLTKDLIPLLNEHGDMYLAGRILGMIDCQPKTDWIPCEERMPENDTNVIACFSCGTVTELLYLGNGIFQGIYEYNTKVIIAWQPLPQPYKKEGAE